jgi:hypothetical protein
MTNTGSLAGTRALHIQHVFAAIGALSPAAFRVAAHGAIDAYKDDERDVGAEAFRGRGVEKKADAATGQFIG